MITKIFTKPSLGFDYLKQNVSSSPRHTSGKSCISVQFLNLSQDEISSLFLTDIRQTKTSGLLAKVVPAPPTYSVKQSYSLHLLHQDKAPQLHFSQSLSG